MGLDMFSLPLPPPMVLLFLLRVDCCSLWICVIYIYVHADTLNACPCPKYSC